MNVQQILTNAIYKSVQDRAFQRIIEPHYYFVALDQLNYILDEWRDRIPYQSEITFNNVDNLLATTFVEVISVLYIINNVPTQLAERTITQFKREKSPTNLIGYPEIYYFDQLNQNIDVFPLPSNPEYQFTVNGRVATYNLGQFDLVPINIPPFMVNALTYELAFRITAEYGVPWDAKKETIRQQLLMDLDNKKSVDLTPAPTCDLGMPSVSSSAPFPLWYYLSGGQ